MMIPLLRYALLFALSLSFSAGAAPLSGKVSEKVFGEVSGEGGGPSFSVSWARSAWSRAWPGERQKNGLLLPPGRPAGNLLSLGVLHVNSGLPSAARPFERAAEAGLHLNLFHLFRVLNTTPAELAPQSRDMVLQLNLPF